MEALILFALGWLFLGGGAQRQHATPGKMVDEGSSLDVNGNSISWSIYQKPDGYRALWDDGGELHWFERGTHYATKEEAIYELFEAINRGDVKASP